ncbi:MAG: hypothetical protein V7K34_18155, partial [Nostoc sp.]
ESSALNNSNLLSGWLSYVRTGYRDSLNNESHTTLCFTHNQQLKFYLGSKFILPEIMAIER